MVTLQLDLGQPAAPAPVLLRAGTRCGRARRDQKRQGCARGKTVTRTGGGIGGRRLSSAGSDRVVGSPKCSVPISAGMVCVKAYGSWCQQSHPSVTVKLNVLVDKEYTTACTAVLTLHVCII